VFKEKLPIIQTLGNPGLRERHWEQISEIVGFPIRPTPELTLQKIIDMNLDEYLPKFELISEAASKEHSLEKNLEKMKAEWADMKFQIVSYRYDLQTFSVISRSEWLDVTYKVTYGFFLEKRVHMLFLPWMKFKLCWMITSLKLKLCWALLL
jgi:hypothetical protein